MKYQFSVKHYPLSWLVFLIVVVLSFMPIPETPLSDVQFIDKWTHIVMYFGQSIVIWFEYCRHHGLRFAPAPHGLRLGELNYRKLHLYAVIYTILLGGVIEILQEMCTHHMRSGDWLDWAADTIGVLLAWLLAKAGLNAYEKIQKER